MLAIAWEKKKEIREGWVAVFQSEQGMSLYNNIEYTKPM